MNEEMIKRVLSKDYSAGTERFRENLLQQCLATIDAQNDGMELSDDELDMLAAAGNPFEDQNPFRI